MGLAERKILKEFQTSFYESWKAKFDKVLGFESNVEVKWDTLHTNEYSYGREQYFEWWETGYFSPLLEVFKQICSDDMGKEAVKDGLKKIIIDGSTGDRPEDSKFDDGVFRINHQFSNISAEEGRVNGWRKMIEAKL